MRNVFDQYQQPENRLTHSLASALGNDRRLLRHFLRRVLRIRPPRRAQLLVVEQQLPGDLRSEEEEPGRRGLPDLVIHDENGWAVAFESKVAAKLTRSQLVRHRKTLASRGFDEVHIVVVDVRESAAKVEPSAISIQWADVYMWARRQDSWWAQTLADYLEIAERHMIDDGYLKEGALTRFSGIPFGLDAPYNYPEAKRLLGLAMKELRKLRELGTRLGADLAAPGRGAITGSASKRVWDYIPLKVASDASSHTKYPHLSFDIGEDETRAYLSIPNGVPKRVRNRLFEHGESGFRDVISDVLGGFQKRLQQVDGASPFLHLTQRRFPSQRALGLVDALLKFDPRTAFPNVAWKAKPAIKPQPQWLRAAYETLKAKRSNIHLSIGVSFAHTRCPGVSKPGAIRMFADAWLACAPVLECVLGE